MARSHVLTTAAAIVAILSALATTSRAACVTKTFSNQVSQQCDGGEVFLRGKYIELGVSSAGSLGTMIKPTDPTFNVDDGAIFPWSFGVGLIIDTGLDGFDTGSGSPDLYMGDVFLPGSPIEGFTLQFSNSGLQRYTNVLLAGEAQMPSTSSSDLSHDGHLCASWTGEVTANVRMSQLIEFDVDDVNVKFTVTIENIAAVPITDVYYIRNMDPDIEQPWTGDYRTKNYVDFHPDRPGSGPADACMVTAEDVSLNSFSLSLGGIHPACRANHVGFFNRNPVATYNDNKWKRFSEASPSLADEGINIVFKKASMAPGEQWQFQFAYFADKSALNTIFVPLVLTLVEPAVSTVGGNSVEFTVLAPSTTSAVEFFLTIFGGSRVSLGTDSTGVASGGDLEFSITFDSLPFGSSSGVLLEAEATVPGGPLAISTVVTLDNQGPSVSLSFDDATHFDLATATTATINYLGGPAIATTSCELLDSPAATSQLKDYGSDTASPFEFVLDVSGLAVDTPVLLSCVAEDAVGRSTTVTQPGKVDNTDEDGDGVEDEDDKCAETAMGATVDANGCAAEQIDFDIDGICNPGITSTLCTGIDLCPGTMSGATVDGNGCTAADLDSDGDGVCNPGQSSAAPAVCMGMDLCAGTPLAEVGTVDNGGCSPAQVDLDADGVCNNGQTSVVNSVTGEGPHCAGADLCDDTPATTVVDASGCSALQVDADLDGVCDLAATVSIHCVPGDDICPFTLAGEPVDIHGCSRVQVDSDLDGICDSGATTSGFCTNEDLCPGTTPGKRVDLNGCASSDLDLDGDGVCDIPTTASRPVCAGTDICPDTAAGETVDSDGCSSMQADADEDTVPDALDICPGTPVGSVVDRNGCTAGDVDTDGDGFCNLEGVVSSLCTGLDNCPDIANVDQEDTDGDLIGDVCDDDPGCHLACADDMCDPTFGIDPLGCTGVCAAGYEELETGGCQLAASHTISGGVSFTLTATSDESAGITCDDLLPLSAAEEASIKKELVSQYAAQGIIISTSQITLTGFTCSAARRRALQFGFSSFSFGSSFSLGGLSGPTATSLLTSSTSIGGSLSGASIGGLSLSVSGTSGLELEGSECDTTCFTCSAKHFGACLSCPTTGSTVLDGEGPTSCIVPGFRKLYACSRSNSNVYLVDPATGSSSIVTSMFSTGSFSPVHCAGMGVDPTTDLIYVIMVVPATQARQFGRLNIVSGAVTPISASTVVVGMSDLSFDCSGNAYTVSEGTDGAFGGLTNAETIFKVTLTGSITTACQAKRFDTGEALAFLASTAYHFSGAADAAMESLALTAPICGSTVVAGYSPFALGSLEILGATEDIQLGGGEAFLVTTSTGLFRVTSTGSVSKLGNTPVPFDGLSWNEGSASCGAVVGASFDGSHSTSEAEDLAVGAETSSATDIETSVASESETSESTPSTSDSQSSSVESELGDSPSKSSSPDETRILILGTATAIVASGMSVISAIVYAKKNASPAASFRVNKRLRSAPKPLSPIALADAGVVSHVPSDSTASAAAPRLSSPTTTGTKSRPLRHHSSSRSTRGSRRSKKTRQARRPRR